MNLSENSGVAGSVRIGIAWLAMLIGIAGTVPAQALPAQVELQPAKAMPGDMQVKDCLPCAFCYMAPPVSERVGSNPDKPYLPAVPRTRWPEPTSAHHILDLLAAPRSTIALRILFCRWTN